MEPWVLQAFALLLFASMIRSPATFICEHDSLASNHAGHLPWSPGCCKLSPFFYSRFAGPCAGPCADIDGCIGTRALYCGGGLHWDPRCCKLLPFFYLRCARQKSCGAFALVLFALFKTRSPATMLGTLAGGMRRWLRWSPVPCVSVVLFLLKANAKTVNCWRFCFLWTLPPKFKKFQDL